MDLTIELKNTWFRLALAGSDEIVRIANFWHRVDQSYLAQVGNAGAQIKPTEQINSGLQNLIAEGQGYLYAGYLEQEMIGYLLIKKASGKSLSKLHFHLFQPNNIRHKAIVFAVAPKILDFLCEKLRIENLVGDIDHRNLGVKRLARRLKIEGADFMQVANRKAYVRYKLSL